ncbi:DUF4834 family protein [Cyclobacterium qasimii]|uniref:DUF4834 domain-containing protein n=2 Tax=Cyclobacterium qasimii TaxID=1350429 RepID=S7VE54_9BACT|nr:DUF4834 family protein [Cyclobacterium qasimii]EPR68515.1 hypothetical protein ADICYQ_2481 [Cyclobacterium qasimii M12-11B]GEO23700.1 hypothetical protein CQA01_42340 [Cyclobacterium qasimii]
MILKIIIFFIALGWVFSSLFKFFLNSKLKKFADQVKEAHREETKRKTQPKDGNVNVDFVPKDKKNGSSGTITGGDYIDYEEVKD